MNNRKNRKRVELKFIFKHCLIEGKSKIEVLREEFILAAKGLHIFKTCSREVFKHILYCETPLAPQVTSITK